MESDDERYYRGEIIPVDDTGEEYQRSQDLMRERNRADNASPVHRLERAIRSKSQWEEKIFDENIAKKYKIEAQALGVAADVVDNILEQLRGEANYIVHGRSTVSCGVSSSTSSRAVVPKSPSFNWGELKKAVSAMHAKLAAGEGVEEGLEEKGNGVWVADKIVPRELRELLENRLDAMANSPNKDFHPNTNDQVQDLIHPSLFPYIDGVSPLCVEKANLPEKPIRTYWQRRYEDSTYQWLPAEFLVDENGSIKIETYINNLDEKEEWDLYRGIELLFEIFVPLFEKLTFENEKLNPKLNLHGRKLQVIVKAANYVIHPKGQVFEGSWHVEGMSHEAIIASGIYYYSTSPILNDDGLVFRRERIEEKDYPQVDEYDRSMEEEMGDDFPNLDGLTMSIELGTVPTIQDRLIVFPNGLQHKVSGIKNDSQDQVGTRKTLVIFLVDPDLEIVSTRHVPPQQWESLRPGIVKTMCLVVKRVTGKSFRRPLIEEIVSRAKSGLTMEEARRHRLDLMRERKYKIEYDNEVWEREYSLCEH